MEVKTDFESCYDSSPVILMEGALGERLKREYDIPYDKTVDLAGHIYNEKSKQALRELFTQYVKIATDYNFPLMITTPTRRANRDRVLQSRFNKQIIDDNVSFLQEIKKKSHSKVYLGGLMGCKGDAYKADSVLSEGESFEFHLWQADLFAEAQVDFLYAGIMPALTEAIGMARAMENTRLPYIISFMIRENGKLIDGTTIHEAITAIDLSTKRKPLCYMTNCVHPTIVYKALSQNCNRTKLVDERFKGVQANTSPLPPEQLDHRLDLKTADPSIFAADMFKLCQNFHLKIFGGCCGTDDRHMAETAKLLKNNFCTGSTL